MELEPLKSMVLSVLFLSLNVWVCLVQGLTRGQVNFCVISACCSAVHLLAWNDKKTLQTLLVWDESWLCSFLCF